MMDSVSVGSDLELTRRKTPGKQKLPAQCIVGVDLDRKSRPQNFNPKPDDHPELGWSSIYIPSDQLSR